MIPKSVLRLRPVPLCTNSPCNIHRNFHTKDLQTLISPNLFHYQNPRDKKLFTEDNTFANKNNRLQTLHTKTDYTHSTQTTDYTLYTHQPLQTQHTASCQANPSTTAKT